MKENANYYYGWIDSGIPEILDILQDDLPRNSYMMITELDSDRKPADGFVYKKLMQNAGLQIEKISRAFSLPVQNISNLQDSFDNLFPGFDEVWFFTGPELSVPPMEISIVSTVHLRTPNVDAIERNKDLKNSHDVATIIAWMSKSKCYLGMGDGIGLNYITDRKDLATRIEEFQGHD